MSVQYHAAMREQARIDVLNLLPLLFDLPFNQLRSSCSRAQRILPLEPASARDDEALCHLMDPMET